MVMFKTYVNGDVREPATGQQHSAPSRNQGLPIVGDKVKTFHVDLIFQISMMARTPL